MYHFLGHEFDPHEGTLDKSGYLVIYTPWHPMAWKSSKLMFVHRLVMEVKLNRILESIETVHHVDENTVNNKPDNLELLSNADHSSLHKNSSQIFTCKICGKISGRTKKNKYCSPECAHLGNRMVSDEEITNIYELNKHLPMYKIAKLVGISDVGLKKRLIKLNLIA